MPRRVDHQQRKEQIADALLRVASTRGLHAVGMRDVAAEAGVSVRLVQYYFDTKEQLLLYTLRYLAEQMSERVRARVRAAGTGPTPRTVIDAILNEALPTDQESRTFSIVYASYAALALTDQTFSVTSLVSGSNAIEQIIADQLHAAQRSGQMPSHLDADAEATSLLAISAGLGTSVLAGQRTADDALRILRYQLDRLLPIISPMTPQ